MGGVFDEPRGCWVTRDVTWSYGVMVVMMVVVVVVVVVVHYPPTSARFRSSLLSGLMVSLCG